VQRLLRTHDPAGALDAYRRLLAEDPTTRLPADAQLELANCALHGDQADLAATAYERFLAVAGNDPRRDEVQLLLALVLVRRLAAPARARPLLEGLAERLDDPARKALATALAAEASE
jgi:outer membrane protein assembly factor BamD (BamD/ComL family)